jgi:hexosaminidase
MVSALKVEVRLSELWKVVMVFRRLRGFFEMIDAITVLLAVLVFAAAGVRAQQPSIVPAVLHFEKADGTLRVSSGEVVAYPAGDSAAKFAAMHLVDMLRRTSGLQLIARPEGVGASRGAVIVLKRQASPVGGDDREAYDLDVSKDRVTIQAADAAGLYYGSVSLWQLLTAEPASVPVTLQCEHIHDQPQMRWRGIMVDSARHMQSVGYLRQLVDWMSLEKLNVLHWHLTDDQGWRLEIKRYPKLTSVGGWRELASEEDKPKYGGFYTQDEVRSLVAYALARNVTIVPEIEMPGHASAALAAYPQFGASSDRLAGPANHYGIFPSLYNVNDATFTFLENILTEVMQMFPSEYIHIGGDEAIKNQWKASPAIQEEMKRLGVTSEDELQSYFVKRIDTFLTEHHRRTLGWDEILQGGLAPNAAVMSWHGVKGAIDAAKQGHDAVLTPVRPLYFNYRQSDAADEAPGRWSLNTLADVYKFDPEPSTLTVEERKHVLGVQANVWTEYLITDERVTWMLFPRTAALAEIGWSAPERRNWADFEDRMVGEMARYHSLGIGYDPDAFRVYGTETLAVGKSAISITLANQTGFGTIRYTTDKSMVLGSSVAYEKPLELSLPVMLHAATFADNRIVPGSDVTLDLNEESVRRRYSQELKLCSNEPAIAMEQDPPTGKRPVMLANYRTPCWIYKAAELTGVTGVSAEVVAIPYVFQDGDKKQPQLAPTQTPYGELEVHLDSCEGKILATLPFEKTTTFNVTERLRSPLPTVEGTHDLCLKAVRPVADPLWVLNWTQLEVKAGNGGGSDR